MSNHSGQPPAAHPAVGHLVGVPILLGTCLSLLVLTWLTVAAYQVNLGALNIWIALGIATLKSALVCMYFMHLRYDRPFNSIVLVTTLLFVLLFIGFAMTDSLAYHDTLIPPSSPEYAPALRAPAG